MVEFSVKLPVENWVVVTGSWMWTARSVVMMTEEGSGWQLFFSFFFSRVQEKHKMDTYLKERDLLKKKDETQTTRPSMPTAQETETETTLFTLVTK